VLRIGLPPVGCGVLFATMFATYRSRYPDIDIELTEYGSKRLRECLEAGEVDLAALLLPVDAGFDYQPVRNEPLMAVLPRDATPWPSVNASTSPTWRIRRSSCSKPASP